MQNVRGNLHDHASFCPGRRLGGPKTQRCLPVPGIEQGLYQAAVYLQAKAGQQQEYIACIDCQSDEVFVIPQRRFGCTAVYSEQLSWCNVVLGGSKVFIWNRFLVAQHELSLGTARDSKQGDIVIRVGTVVTRAANDVYQLQLPRSRLEQRRSSSNATDVSVYLSVST
jgi:hypothetical protein